MNIKLKLKINEYTHEEIYLFFVFVLVFRAVSMYSQVLKIYMDKIDFIWTLLSFGVAIMIILTARTINLIQFWVLSFCCGLGVIVYILHGWSQLIFLTILFVYSKGKDPHKIASIIFKTLVTVFVFNILCTVYFILFDQSNLYIRNSFHESRPQLDLSCGGHPNHTACIWNAIMMLYFYKKWNCLNKVNLIIILITTGILYVFVGSDALFLVVGMTMLYIIRNNKTIKKVLSIFVKYSMLILLGFSLIYKWVSKVPFLYGFANWINTLSTGRFLLSSTAIDRYGVTVLGKTVEMGLIKTNGVTEYLYVDNSYVYMLISQGIIYILLLQLLLFVGSKYLDFKSLSIVSVLLLYGLIETSMTNYIMIFPFLNVMICIYLFNRIPDKGKGKVK